MNAIAASLPGAFVGLILGIAVAWVVFLIQDRKDKQAEQRAEELSVKQHNEDQEEITSLHAELTSATNKTNAQLRKQREDYRREQQLQKPVRVMFEERSPEKYVLRPQVARPEILTELLGKLFTSESRVVIVGGDFGVGKTWVTREIARIAGAYGKEKAGHVAPFSGGLLCTSLGQNPVISDELRRWHHHILKTNLAAADETPEKLDPAFDPTAETTIPEDDREVAAEIATYLSGRQPLLIIDDIWDAGAAELLLKAAPDSPVLMTTSSSAVFKAYVDGGATGVTLTGLTLEQERQLLGSYIDERALPDSDTAPGRKAAFIRQLSGRVDSDPFSVVQAGAFVCDRLGALRTDQGTRSWSTISERDLSEIVREIASLPEAAAGEVSDRDAWIQPEHRPGPDVYLARLKDLRDPVKLAVLRTLSLLRPKPELFTAPEIAAMIVPQLSREGGGDSEQTGGTTELPPLAGIRAALDELAKGFFLDRTEPPGLDRDPDLGPGDDATATRAEAGYGLHNRARRTLFATIGDVTRQEFLEKAVDYWRSWIDPRHPDTHIQGASAYQIAMSRDDVDWLRATQNLMYHLRHLKNHGLARQTFTAIYFELFFWWGWSLRSEGIEEFLRDWPAGSRGQPDPQDTEWFEAMSAFHRGYLPGHDTVYRESEDWRPGIPEYQGNQYYWPDVTTALETILRTAELSISPDWADQHDQWHTQALIDIFLADSLRYRPSPETRGLATRIDRCHQEARALIQRCNDEDETRGREAACAWILPWIDWQEADEALRRSMTAEDTAARDAQRLIAANMTAAAIRGVLAGDDETEPTDDRDELDYEVLASVCMTRGDLELARDGIRPAATWYADAIVLARTWQYRPRTDDFTRTFSGHVSEHVRREMGARLDTAAGDQTEAAAAIATVARNGYAGQWGSSPAAEPLDPAVFGDSLTFMATIMGDMLPAGRHDDDTDPIPFALAQAADRVIEELWKTTQETPADHSAKPAA